MAYALQWTRSFLFMVQMYLMMLVFGLVFAPLAAFDRKWAVRAVHAYCGWVRWTARWMVGLRTEIRGQVPTGEVLLAPKHQSFLDIIMIASVLPQPKFIMKASLRWAPVLGWFGLRLGCVPVDRGKRSEAIHKMVRDVKHGDAPPGQLVIYPQGTRVAPGVARPFKVGTYVLHEQTGQTVYPAATNVGVFWPRLGIYRKPGLAVVEFLPPIPDGLNRDDFMTELERVVETASDRLLDEAGFQRPA
jgi:1-acyl-sn-glycerol-3-phosphate acyltransferase